MSGGKRIGRRNETLIEGARTILNTQYEEIPPLAVDVADDITDNTTGDPAATELVAIGDTSAGNEGPSINDNFATLLAFVKTIASLLFRNKQMEVVGLNADAATLEWSPKGGMKATTGATTGDQVIARPIALRRAAQPWVPEEESRNTSALKTGDSIASLRFALGLRDGGASAPDSPGAGDLQPGADDWEAFFYYDPAFNNGEIAVTVKSTAAGANDTRTTGITPAVDSLYRFNVEFDENRVPRFFMSINDGSEFEVGATEIVDGLPEALDPFEAMETGAPLLPIQGIETKADAAVSASLCGVSLGLLNPGADPVYATP